MNRPGDSFSFSDSHHASRFFWELTERTSESTQTPREMADASPSVADLAAMASLHVRSKSAGAAVELAGSNQQLGASPSPVPHHGGAPRGVSGFSGVTPVHGGEGGAKPGTLMTSPVSTLMLPALNLSVETTPGFGGDVSMSPGGLTMNEEEPMTPFGAPTTAPFGPTPGADGVGWTPPPVDRSRETRKCTGGTRGKAKTGGFRHMGGMAHGEHDNDDDDMDEDDDWDAHDLASDDSLRAEEEEDDGDDTRTPPSTRAHLGRFGVDVDARMASPAPRDGFGGGTARNTAVLSSIFDAGFDSRDAHGGLGSPVPFGGFQNGFQTGFQMFDDTSRLPHTPPRPVKARSDGGSRAAAAPPLARFDSLRETKVLVSTSALARCGSGKIRPAPNVYVPGSSAAASAGIFGHDDTSRGSADGRGAGSSLPSSRADSPVEFRFHDHFDFQRLIGRSPTSEAWLVRSKQSNKPYCVKKVTAKFRTPGERSRYIHEVESVCFLPPHPNVVKYYRAWQENRHFYAQMELCECGSFGACLARLPPCSLVDEVDVWRMAAQVARGLSHVHAHGILHLDVKPDNVLLDASGTYKLGDFGVAYVKDKGWELQDGDGGYVAPEVLAMNPADPGSIPTSAADIFSLGASLHEAASGRRLAQEWRRGIPVTRGELIAPGGCEEAGTGRGCRGDDDETFVLPLPEGRSDALARLVSDCVRRDPRARLSAAEVARLATAALTGAGFDA